MLSEQLLGLLFSPITALFAHQRYPVIQKIRQRMRRTGSDATAVQVQEPRYADAPGAQGSAADSGSDPAVIVDIGTGDGTIAAALAQQHPSAQVIALEPRPREDTVQRLAPFDNVALIRKMWQAWNETDELPRSRAHGQADLVLTLFPNQSLGAPEFRDARQQLAELIAELLRPGTGEFILVTVAWYRTDFADLLKDKSPQTA